MDRIRLNAELATFRAEVWTALDRLVSSIAQLANVPRRPKKYSAWEMAVEALRLKDEEHLSGTKIAERLGLQNRAHANNLVRAMKRCHPSLLAELRAGTATLPELLRVVTLPKTIQPTAIRRLRHAQ
jgi:biotin operon repressor